MCSLKLFRTPVYPILCTCMLSHSSHVQLFANLWTVVCQASPSMGFSQQEYWNWFCQALLQGIIATQGSTRESCTACSSVQSLSHVQLFATPWTATRQASLSITNSRSSLTNVHRVGDATQPSYLLSSPSPPAPNPSKH